MVIVLQIGILELKFGQTLFKILLTFVIGDLADPRLLPRLMAPPFSDFTLLHAGVSVPILGLNFGLKLFDAII